jgi:hypothetical protein
VPVPNISAAITLISSAFGRDLRGDNPLLGELALDRGDATALIARCLG